MNTDLENNKHTVIGCDVGTMFFQVAYPDKTIKTIRNAFVEISDMEGIEDILNDNGWQYVKDNNSYYIIGEDSLRVAQMFPGKVELRRPLQDGVLNKNEDKKMLVLSELISSTIGKAPDDKSVVCICVSSPSVDDSIDSTYHKARLSAMFSRLGWHVKVIEEGYAVVLSECPIMEEPDGTKSKFSGAGISFGGGRSNCVLAYKALPVIGMSASKCGDYIDRQVADQLGIPISQVTSIKEKKLDFDNIDYENDIIFALDAFYENMIKNVFTHFCKKFKDVKSDFTAPLEIIVAGGTSLPNGFCKKVENVLHDMELPFKIKSVRRAKEPRNAVVNGCLAQAMVTKKKLDQSVTDSGFELID